jgi:glucose-6-phosphate dehydrogenase assembly protein OpcA
MASSTTEEAVWAAQDTTPSAIEAALRHLLEERHKEDQAFVPARVLNLICIVEREWRGEIENRLERVGRFHPSRTVLIAVERGRDTIDAVASLGGEAGHKPGEIHVGEERVELAIGEEHLQRLESIVDPLVVTDLVTLVWSPHGYDEAVESIIGLAGVVMVDSVQSADPRAAIARAQRLLDRAYVVDLAWLRSAPWRERIAATFDPPQWRAQLQEITSVTVSHHPDSTISGALLLGWLASRLGWDPSEMEPEDDGIVCRARTEGRKVKLRLEVDASMPVPGLAGLDVDTASGVKLSLYRGEGGLTAKRKLPGGKESSWVVLGASRGEAGILGEGIRQALLRDPTYGPALTAACRLLGA